MPVTFNQRITAYVLNKYHHGGRVDVIDTRDYRSTPVGVTRNSYHKEIGETMVSAKHLYKLIMLVITHVLYYNTKKNAECLTLIKKQNRNMISEYSMTHISA